MPATLDGATNGVKAIKILGIPFIIGVAHNLVCNILSGIEEADVELHNPELKALLNLGYAIAAKQ